MPMLADTLRSWPAIGNVTAREAMSRVATVSAEPSSASSTSRIANCRALQRRGHRMHDWIARDGGQQPVARRARASLTS
jgi:D-aminopeptidase